MADFRKLGADRNSIAINKAVGGAITGPVRYPVTGDITTGEIVTVEWLDEPAPDWPSATSTARVGLRKTAALLAGYDTGGKDFDGWSLDGQILTVTLDIDGEEGDVADFWVF
jgi:hypothetical protein